MSVDKEKERPVIKKESAIKKEFGGGILGGSSEYQGMRDAVVSHELMAEQLKLLINLNDEKGGWNKIEKAQMGQRLAVVAQRMAIVEDRKCQYEIFPDYIKGCDVVDHLIATRMTEGKKRGLDDLAAWHSATIEARSDMGAVVRDEDESGKSV